MNKSKEINELFEEICSKRKELAELFLEDGNTNKVLLLSQELDKMLNRYDSLIKKN